jgi:hypothetical protein
MGTKRSKLLLQFLILNSTFLTFFSCSFQKIVPPPPNNIGADTMQLIITDLSILEAALNNGVPNDTLKKINVLEKYHISPQRFDSSFTYYSHNPTKLKEVYAKVLENLNSK